MAPHLASLFTSTEKHRACWDVHTFTVPPRPNLSDLINNKNNIWKVTQPKMLWDICHQLSRKCVSGCLDCCTLSSTRLETERLAGSVIHIYVDVTLLSAFGLSTGTYED